MCIAPHALMMMYDVRLRSIVHTSCNACDASLVAHRSHRMISHDMISCHCYAMTCDCYAMTYDAMRCAMMCIAPHALLMMCDVRSRSIVHTSCDRTCIAHAFCAMRCDAMIASHCIAPHALMIMCDVRSRSIVHTSCDRTCISGSSSNDVMSCHCHAILCHLSSSSTQCVTAAPCIIVFDSRFLFDFNVAHSIHHGVRRVCASWKLCGSRMGHIRLLCRYASY